MRKIKKLTLLSGVVLILLTPLLGMAPYFVGTAQAINAPIGNSSGSVGLVGSASTPQNAAVWVLARGAASCLYNADYAGGASDDPSSPAKPGFISESDANSGKWSSELDGGHHVGWWTSALAEGKNDGNDKADCNKVIDAAIKNMSSVSANNNQGSINAATVLCALGFTRTTSGTTVPCTEGVGGFQAPSSMTRGGKDSNADAFGMAWDNFVLTTYFGLPASTTLDQIRSRYGGIPALTNAMRYYIYYTNFSMACGDGSGKPNSGIKNVGPWDDASNKVGTNTYKLDWLNNNAIETDAIITQKPNSYSIGGSSFDGSNILSSQDLGGDQTPTCKKVASLMNSFSDDYTTQIATETTNGITQQGTQPGGSSPSIDCQYSWTGIFTFGLAWLMCPLVKGAVATANTLEDQIDGMLCINESQIFSGTQSTCHGAGDDNDAQSAAAFHNAWNVFRILALGLLAIAGLIMILSQGLGFEIFDAYTIKKTLPRILVAAIGITLSWNVLEFAVQLSNGVGIGVRSLIYSPFNTANYTVVLNGGSTAIGAIFGATGFLLLGVLGGLSFILTGLLGIIIAFATLVLRNTLVILLIIMAPVGIAAYILPNTEKYWKLWWDWLFRALLVFPIITAIIATGHVFAAITSTNKESTLDSIVAFFAYFGPYFLIPAAFRFAGGAMATLGGFANDRSRGIFDRLSGFRKGQTDARMSYYGQRYGDRFNQSRAQAIRSLNSAASKRGRFVGGAMRFAGRQLGPLGGIEQTMSAINARTGKRLNDQIATGTDANIRGLTVNRKAADALGGNLNAPEGNGLKRITADGVTQYQSLGGAWIDEADVLNGQREWGNDHAAQQAAVSYEMRKAMTNRQVAGISERYASLAKDQFGMTDTQAGGAWIGAAFENQNTHLEYKNTDWKTGKLDAKKFSMEAYEKKGSYQLSQMSAHTIKQLGNAYDSGDAEDKARIKAVTETFMHQLGATGAVDDDGQPIMEARGGGNRQVSSNGPGHLGEEVYELARKTGILAQAPNGPYGPPGSPQTGTAPSRNQRRPEPPDWRDNGSGGAYM